MSDNNSDVSRDASLVFLSIANGSPARSALAPVSCKDKFGVVNAIANVNNERIWADI